MARASNGGRLFECEPRLVFNSEMGDASQLLDEEFEGKSMLLQ